MLQTRAPRPLLVSDAFTFLAVGGAAVVVPLSLGLYVRTNAVWSMTGPLATFLWLALILPHYTSSYQLLYWDRRAEILRSPSFFLAGVLVPLATAVLLMLVYIDRPLLTMAALLHILFLLSGWHYAKQAYGATLALSAAKRSPLSRPEKDALRANLLALAAVIFIMPNTRGNLFAYEYLTYHPLGLPLWVAVLGLGALTATFVRLALVFAPRLKSGAGLSWIAVASFLSIYAWGVPLILYPNVFHAFRDVPFVAALHSLQYMVFVLALRLNREPESPRAPAPWLAVGASLLAVIVVGDVLARILPNWLDRVMVYDRAALGVGFFFSASTLFVNIHHFFIDSVVWRGDNHEFREMIAGKAAG
ncbi:MAG TPA: hypothetical protein VN915_07895 [Elusimicrobiota bacterium]|nr:hypothetical protein [Elusimicrobiota bacterium]